VSGYAIVGRWACKMCISRLVCIVRRWGPASPGKHLANTCVYFDLNLGWVGFV
jgi:hypothetical protein